MLSFLYLPKEKWGKGLQLECDGELMDTRKPDQMLWAMIYGTESLKTLILVCLGHLGKGWWPSNLPSPLLTWTLEELMVKMVRQSFSLLVSCCANLPLKGKQKSVPMHVAKVGNRNRHPAVNGPLIFLTLLPPVSENYHAAKAKSLWLQQYNKSGRSLYTLTYTPHPYLTIRKISKGVFFSSLKYYLRTKTTFMWI